MAERGLIICNTTPLINFAEIGRIDLLEGLFVEVVVPPAVQKELREKGALFLRAAAIAEGGHFATQEPSDSLLVQSFAGTLHPGESECLALAIENPGSLLLLDDLAARGFAEIYALPFTGTLGCLVTAKSRGLIEVVAPLLEELRQRARFWISKTLEEAVLRSVGEA